MLQKLLWLGAALTSFAAATENTHVIDSLPNFNGSVPFTQYAGHLQLATEEKLFYWYTESQNKPDTDPIVLWLNGGPGCSSLGGFFTENGPFVVHPDLTVKTNNYGWNRKVNLVWLEQPAGVGFSGPLQDAEYYNDDNVAQKAYEFVGLFFEKYPELKNREFYITGESYAGIYIPFLVDLLVDYPIEGVNLAGFAIGNPFTDNDIDGNAYIDYYYSHALISIENYHDMVKNCGAQIGTCMYTSTNCTEDCQKALDEGINAIQEDQFNPYFIYGDKCLLSNGQGESLRYVTKLEPSPARRGDIGPCADLFTESYLHLPEVQTALHVGDYVSWTDCNDDISEFYTRADSSLPKYQNILGRGLKALIYSGDADSVVNFLGTERWIGPQGLKLNIANKWRAWFGPDQQLAGYVQDYEGLTFLTVKGAGHMVPAVRPLHGLYMFECFVFGNDACATFDYPADVQEFEAGDNLDAEIELNQIRPRVTSSIGPVLMFAVVGSVMVAIVAAGYKNIQNRRNSYQPIGTSV